ncbi:ligase-associated DNA damage response endonuclease PdeM [Rhizobiaceae bacterium BDR2-2]|uniref:Ligase-associated DNA damage response endonuclease PdeM n=2 Tax=Ectorhizobium quercum TaxID=2965071 RepID=A0AAE3MXB9_9HYPH|nr:ligase-associated DNA damage response endonuclease PdeM [Ectorhizobium quercum]MCX8996001.1 ligase-associated DNA damage response endonuclease PdeM [Ectorhizobium quercum]
MVLAETLKRAAPESGAAITVAGTRAVCEPTGALWLPEFRLLVVSDLHLEKGAAFARRRQFLPPYDTAATLALLEQAVARRDPDIVVSLGDSFHDRIGSSQLAFPFRERLSSLARGRQWIWINGNHDPDGVEGLAGEVADEIAFGALVFRHEPKPGRARGEVAGHLHPAAAVTRWEKTVRRPCFACDGERLVMPSFGVMTGGLDLRHRAFGGLFDPARLTAHLLNAGRVYSVRYGRLSG